MERTRRKRSLQTQVSAPGKVMVCGEYAVRHGAVAVVAAVSRRLYLTRSTFACDGSRLAADRSAENVLLPREVVVSQAMASEMLGIENVSSSTIDMRELHDHGTKLGLGSSAAAAAAGAASVFASQQYDVSSLPVRDAISKVAFEAHRLLAPHGSGADVAAAVWGGYVTCRKREVSDQLEVHPLPEPAGVYLSVVWTKVQSRTHRFLQAMQEFEAREPASYSACIDQIAQHSRSVIEAWQAGKPASLIAAFAGHHRAMEALGEAAGVPVVTQELGRVSELAHACGGAAKPSGAGGGDVAVAVFDSESDRDAFTRRCAHEGILPLQLELGAPGVRCERAHGDDDDQEDY